MKLITFEYNGVQQIGVLSKDETKVYPIKGYSSMNELIDSYDEGLLNKLAEGINESEAICFADVIKKAPILNPRQDVICLGINYTEHAKESARFHNEAFGGERPYPIYFSKRVNEAPADGDVISGHFNIVDSLDYESELGVILAKDAKDVAPEDVHKYIFGYTVINDVSARNVQTAHKQWYFGKSLDGFTPMGPCILTADEVEYPPALKITSKVNGELRQNSNTDMMITGIDHIVSELSAGITLKAGTIIATGTPAGVGMGMTPPTFLKTGDVVECEIEKIGKLTNSIGD